jgi:hypothetical protein
MAVDHIFGFATAKSFGVIRCSSASAFEYVEVPENVQNHQTKQKIMIFNDNRDIRKFHQDQLRIVKAINAA